MTRSQHALPLAWAGAAVTPASPARRATSATAMTARRMRMSDGLSTAVFLLPVRRSCASGKHFVNGDVRSGPMLASGGDAQGAGSLGGLAAARRRWGPGGGLGALLGRLVRRAVDLDRHCGTHPRGIDRGRGAGRPAAAGALAGGARRARVPGRLRGLERGLGAVVDPARPLVGLPEPRARLRRARGDRALARAVAARVGLRARRRACAAARVGAAREGDPGARLVGADRTAELADRLLERARPAVRDGAAAGDLAGGATGAPALAARRRRRLHLRARRRAAADLLARGRARGGLGVAAWAFTRPGLTTDRAEHSLRVHDGAWFGVVFVLAAVAVGALAYLGSLVEERRPLTAGRRRLLGRIALGVLCAGVAVGAVVLAVEAKPEGWFTEFTSQSTNASLQGGPQHLANVSSSSRWLWWTEAWQAWERQPWRGTGAGSFELTQ